MRIWLTSPYDPQGIEEIETDGDPVGDVFSWHSGDTYQASYYWYGEGVTWHRTKEAAEKAAADFRKKWIEETTMKAARVAALAPPKIRVSSP